MWLKLIQYVLTQTCHQTMALNYATEMHTVFVRINIHATEIHTVQLCPYKYPRKYPHKYPGINSMCKQ
ncbi:hypothetical protein P4S72_16000 [Vibrio sp. PP-XX7]